MSADYKYDVFGNRIEKSVDDDGAGANPAAVTKFALDGWKNTNQHLVGNENWDVWADLNADGSMRTRYARGDVIDELFARIQSGGPDTYWYLTDRLGSIRDVVEADGDVVDSISYDGFGNILTETNDDYRGRYAWTGREVDVEIELQYNRARYYDAKTGRWTSRDPLGFDAGDSNLYRYVTNQPTQQVDPSGLDGLPSRQAMMAAQFGAKKEELAVVLDPDKEYAYAKKIARYVELTEVLKPWGKRTIQDVWDIGIQLKMDVLPRTLRNLDKEFEFLHKGQTLEKSLALSRLTNA